MGDFASVVPTYDGEEHVFAAAHHIVKALGLNKNLTDDVRRLLADLDTQLSTMTKITENNAGVTREVEEGSTDLVLKQMRDNCKGIDNYNFVDFPPVTQSCDLQFDMPKSVARKPRKPKSVAMNQREKEELLRKQELRKKEELEELKQSRLKLNKNQKVEGGGCSAVITVVKKKRDVAVLTDVERTPKFVCDSPNVTVIGPTTSSRVHANKDTMTLCSDEPDTMTVSSYDYDNSGSEFQSMDGEEVSSSKGQGWCSSKSGDVTSVQSTYPYSDSLKVQVEESNSVEPVSESNLPNPLGALNSSLDDICDPGGPHAPNLVATQSLEKLKFLSLCQLPNSSASLERLVDTCEPGLDTPNLVASQASEKLELRSICELPDSLGLETLLFQGLPNLESLRSLSLEGSAHTKTERTPKRIDDSPNVRVIGGSSRMTFSSDDYDSSGYDIQWMDIEEVSSSTGQGLCSSESGDVISIQSTCLYSSEDEGKPHSLNAQVEEYNWFDPVTESKLLNSLVGQDSVDDIYDPGGIHTPNVVAESNLPNSLVGLDSVGDIYDPGGLHMPKVVASQSLEKLNFLPLSKLPNSSASVERSIDTDEPGLHTPNSVASPSLENLNLPSLCKLPDSLVSPETTMFQGLPDLESLRRLTLEGCVQLQNLPYFPETMQIDAVEDRVTQSPRYWGGLTALFSSSSHSPVGQIVGGQIVQLNSLEESTTNLSHGARADQSCRIVSLLENKIARKTLKRKSIATSVISLDDLQPHFAKRCKDAAKSLGVIISLVNRICRQHGICRWPFQQLARSWTQPMARPYGEEIVHLDSSEQQSVMGFDSTNYRARLVRADQSGRAIFHSEKIIAGEALKRGQTTKSLLSLKDLQQHFAGTREDAVKSLGDIYDPGFHMPDSFARKSLEELETLLLWEQPYDILHLVSLRRLRLEGCVWLERLSDLPRTLQNNAVGERLTQSSRCLKLLTAQSASSSRWPIGLPDGGWIVQCDPLDISTMNVAHGAEAYESRPITSPSEKEILRKTLKRKCRSTSDISLEDLKEHFGNRCEDSQKSLGVRVSTMKRICGQHGLHRLFIVKRISRQHGTHQRPFQRRWATRCSIALSLSGFAATNNRAHLGREDQSDSATSLSEKKNTRETSKREWITKSLFSLEDLQQHFGSRRKDVAKSLGVSVSTFKRICRQHGIKRWPNQRENNVWKPPDPQGGESASPIGKTLSTDWQTEIEDEILGDLEVLNEFRPDFIEGPNWLDMVNGGGQAGGSYDYPTAPMFARPPMASAQMQSENMGSSEDWRNSFASPAAEALLEGQVSRPTNWTVPTCSDPALTRPTTTIPLTTPHLGARQDIRSVTLNELIEDPNWLNTVNGVGQAGGSYDYPTAPVFARPPMASAQMLSENMGSSEDWRNSFASPTAEALLEGQVSRPSNWIVPTCSDPAPTQPTTTIPHTTPHLGARQDVRSVTLKATYRDTIIRFELPLMAGIIELKQEVSKRLMLEPGSFNVKYKDDEEEWVLIRGGHRVGLFVFGSCHFGFVSEFSQP